MSQKIGPFGEFAARMSIASDLYSAVLTDRVKSGGLTLAQLSVLSHLARRREAQRITDIARAVQVGQPAVTKMVAKFANAGWVDLVDSPEDKRVKMALISNAGLTHLMTTQKSMFPELAGFLGTIPAADLELVTGFLAEFARFLQDVRKS